MSKLKNILFKIAGSSLVFVIGFLGAFAGSSGTSKSWRRIGIPVIFTVSALISLKSFWVILLMSIAGWLCCGYGIPDLYDEGSAIGRFYYKLFNQNHFYSDVCTRGTIGFLISISFIIVPLLKHNWLVYILGSLGIILTYALISWRDFGTFTFKLKNKTYYLLKVDILTYSILGICGLLIIFK